MNPLEVLWEDNHFIAVNKKAGDLVQPDPSGEPAIEQQVGEYLKVKGNKPGAAFVGVVHRIDRPVGGVVIFAKTSKALVRMNEMVKSREIKKTYWAIVDNIPQKEADTLRSWIRRDPKTNKSYPCKQSDKGAQEAVLNYRLLGGSERYFLLEIDLETGRHHQIRAQLASIGCHIKGDLKYGAKRSNPDGSISLISHRIEFMHPVRKEPVSITAPLPQDKLWQAFKDY